MRPMIYGRKIALDESGFVLKDLVRVRVFDAVFDILKGLNQ